MKKKTINIYQIDSARELDTTVQLENIITLGETQNTYCKINICDNFVIGVKYCNYGIDIDYEFFCNNTLLYVGIGMYLLCVDVKQKKILFIKELQSVFYEIITDTNHNYLCIMCELNIYCYTKIKEIWHIGLRDILNDFDVLNNNILYFTCDNGEKFQISINDGKILEC
jgi:hypothetical protein